MKHFLQLYTLTDLALEWCENRRLVPAAPGPLPLYCPCCARLCSSSRSCRWGRGQIQAHSLEQGIGVQPHPTHCTLLKPSDARVMIYGKEITFYYIDLTSTRWRERLLSRNTGTLWRGDQLRSGNAAYTAPVEPHLALLTGQQLCSFLFLTEVLTYVAQANLEVPMLFRLTLNTWQYVLRLQEWAHCWFWLTLLTSVSAILSVSQAWPLSYS